MKTDSKYRLGIVSMDDKGTNSFVGFGRKLLKSKKALTAFYVVAGILTALAFVFQLQGVSGDIISTILSFGCIFAAGFMWLELIICNFHAGKYLHAAIIILGLIGCFLLMEQICTGYPSSGLDYPYLRMKDTDTPYWMGMLK